MISQDAIAQDLGVVIKPEDQRLFDIKMKTAKKLPKGKLGYGVWTYKIPQFLKKRNIPLTVKKFYPSKIRDVKAFISDNLKDGNDIIVSFNVAAIARPESSVNYVHSVVVSSISIRNNKTIVTLGDPSYKHKKFFDVELEKLLDGMGIKYGKEKSFKVFYIKT